MIRLRATAAFVLTAASAAPCAAQLAVPAHIVPVIAKNGGVGGADWMTSISMSNIGVVNFSATGTEFIITTSAADGAEVASVRRVVPAFSMSQWNLEQLGVPTMTGPGRVEVTIDPDTVIWDPCDQDLNNPNLEGAAFLAYLSRIDQATTDAEFQFGQSDWKTYIDLCGVPVGMSAESLRLLFQ